MILFHISIIGSYINDRGETPAKTCRKGTFKQSNLFDSFGGKDGKESEHMIYVIYRGPVK